MLLKSKSHNIVMEGEINGIHTWAHLRTFETIQKCIHLDIFFPHHFNTLTEYKVNQWQQYFIPNIY